MRFLEWGDCSLTTGTPLTHRLHIAFGVRDRADVDAWWQRLTAAGYRSDGTPGVWPRYNES